jgi:hypothetical protein
MVPITVSMTLRLIAQPVCAAMARNRRRFAGEDHFAADPLDGDEFAAGSAPVPASLEMAPATIPAAYAPREIGIVSTETRRQDQQLLSHA